MSEPQIFEIAPSLALQVPECPRCAERRRKRNARQRAQRLRERLLRPPLHPIGIDRDLILTAVADVYRVTTAALKSDERDQHVCAARFVAMYLLYELSDQSYPQIGRYLGGRDHSTIIHGHRVVTAQMAKNAGYKANIDQIRGAILSERACAA